ncbi:MAG TPA: NUDIX domain-containing protein [Bacillota bacterium]|nr:NUDIX domain-containing protein [Bacillota bacterium]
MKRMNLDGFNIVLLGVVFDPNKKKILIGRREKDPYIEKLTWCFPGGRLNHGKDLEKTLKKKIKEKTGLEIENLGVIFSKIYPEKKDLLSIYFLCEVIGGKEKLSNDLVELKWVTPEELETYFTTSFHPHMKEYVLNLK